MSGISDIDWTVVSVVVWLFLVAMVIFLALCRIVASAHDRKLMRLGVGGASPLHVHLQQLIHSRDKMGIAFTVAAFIFSLVIALLLAHQIYRDAIHRLAHVLSLR